MQVIVTLEEIIDNEKATKDFGFNPHCINEGADLDEKIILTYDQAVKYGFLKNE